MTLRRVFVFAIVGGLLAGCTPFGKGARVDTSVNAAPAPRVLSSSAEERLGARANPRVIAAYGGVYRDADVEAALAGVVSRLVAVSEEPSRRYRITVLDSPVANAFALPGGYLYVTRGLLALASDTSELAAVVSHEIAHVRADHAMRRAEVARRDDIVRRVAAGVLSGSPEAVEAAERSQLAFATFTRTQELEADRLGIALAARAGFDPFAAARFLEKMERYAAFRSAVGARSSAEDFLSSHPTGLARRIQATRAAQGFAGPNASKRDASYLRRIDGLTFGDDSDEGFVRGRTFSHPRLAISFRAPPGFRLENMSDAVVAAAGPSRAMRFDGVPAEGPDPEAYLRTGWVNGLDARSIRSVNANGLPAATARARTGGWHFAIGVVQANRGFYRFIFADAESGTRAATALDRTLQSFRTLTPQEVARLRPLRIDVVEVRRGDTVAGLASRMAGTEQRLQLFRIINGLSAEDRLRPGAQVKIVVE